MKKQTIALPEELHKQLKAQAKREGRILQRLAEEILTDGLNERKKDGLEGARA